MKPTHFVLAAMGSAGDVNPMIALGRGLLERGHQVSIMTNQHFADYVTRTGLSFIGLGDAAQYQQVMQNPDLWHPVRSFNIVARFAMLGVLEESYNILRQMHPDETVIVAAGIFLAGHVVREAQGMRHLTIHLQPSLFRSVYDPPVLGGYRLPDWLPHAVKRAYFNFLDKNVIDRRLAPELNAFRAKLGLPPVQHILGDQQHSPQGNLGLFPDWYAPPPPDWPAVELTGFIQYDAAEQAAMPPDVATFLRVGEPPIVFTPGSANLQARSFFHESVSAAQLLGRRALLVSPYAEQIPDNLPPSVMHVPFAPFSELLPLTAGLVYHGGIGTLAQAIAAGIPHLVTPYGHDQPDNARRLQVLGVGDSLSPGRYTARAVADKLNHLLTDTAVQRNCQQYSQQIDFQSALDSACETVERLATV